MASAPLMMALSPALHALPFSCRKPAPSTAPLSNTLRYSLPRSSLFAGAAPGGYKLGCSSLEITQLASSRQRRPPRRAGTCAVSASSATVVRVTPAAKTLYYNVVLNIASTELTYTTPGQYVSIQVNSSFGEASFFMASAPKEAASGSMEFLIHDVPNTTANALINSKPGDKVEIFNVEFSKGFDIKQLYPASEVDTVLLFASGYGLGPIRALIEAGFEAKIRSDVRLYHFFGTPDQQPYKDKYEEWETSGVKVIPRQQDIPCNELYIRDPLKTCAVLCGSRKMQQEKKDCLLKKGVPPEKILTVFDGYLTGKDTKVLLRAGVFPKFLEMGDEYISFHKDLIA